MTGSELQDHSGEGPIWGFVQQLATERWTGQADVGIDPRVELCVTEGRVYFAQKSDDPPLAARLVGTGVLTTGQLRTGGVHLGDTVSLARLFQRDPSIDRDAVELTVERLTDQLLEQVAEHPVGEVTLHPLRHQPSGMHQWFLESHPAAVPDTAGPMAVLRDVVATMSGEVPVVPREAQQAHPIDTLAAPPAPRPLPPLSPIGDGINLTPFAAPAAPVTSPAPAPAVPQVHTEPSAPEPSEPTEHHTGPIVTEVPEVPALPRLGDLGLTPLPTLGAVGTRVPDPTTADGFMPTFLAADDLPTLADDPITASIPMIRAAEAARQEQTAALTINDRPAAQLANAIAAADNRSRAPEMLTIEGFGAPVQLASIGSPAPSPGGASATDPAPEPLVSGTFAATSLTASPSANPAGAPPDSPAGEIWEMVDELLGLQHLTAATPDSVADRKGRGWLRRRG